MNNNNNNQHPFLCSCVYQHNAINNSRRSFHWRCAVTVTITVQNQTTPNVVFRANSKHFSSTTLWVSIHLCRAYTMNFAYSIFDVLMHLDPFAIFLVLKPNLVRFLLCETYFMWYVFGSICTRCDMLWVIKANYYYNIDKSTVFFEHVLLSRCECYF